MSERANLAAEKRGKIRKYNERIRKSEERKERSRIKEEDLRKKEQDRRLKEERVIRESSLKKGELENDPRYAGIDEQLKWEGPANFLLRIAFGAVFFYAFFAFFYEIYKGLDPIPQLGNAMLYSLLSSLMAILVSYFIIKGIGHKTGDRVNYRDLHQTMNWRQMAYEGIAILFNGIFVVLGLLSIIKTLNFGWFVLAYFGAKIGGRFIAWIVAKYASRRVFLAIGIVMFVIVIMLATTAPLFTAWFLVGAQA